MQTAKTFCRNCGALCALEVTLENGRVTAATPDDTASPYGHYMCVKGHSSVEFLNSPEQRLLTSLERQPDGRATPIVTETALDEIAARLAALIREHGPRSVAIYHGTGAFRSVLGGLLEKAFLSAIGSPNLFSTMTIDQSAKWVTAGRMGVMASGKPSTRDIDLAVIVGNNPVISHQTYPFAAGESGGPGRSLQAAKARGAKIIVIDPRRTETASHADLLIQPLPGNDAVLFAAIAHILLRDGTYNHAFCDRFVTQLDALKQAVEPFTPALAARLADVPQAQIELAAAWIGAARRPFIGSGSGPSMSANSNLNDHLIETVNALVGGYKRAGDLLRNPGTLNPRAAVETVVPPSRSWERGVKCHSADIGKLYGEFPTALLPQEILTPGPDRIRALINFGGNPVMGLGDPARAIAGFEGLELLVSLDSRRNETTALSHYVIATSHPFERHDITIPGDALFPVAFAQYAPPVVEKPAGVIDDWEFFWAVAARMGIPLTLKYWTYGLDYDAIADGMALGTETRPDPEAMVRFLCKRSRVPFDDLLANPSGVRPQLPPQYVKRAEHDNGARLELCPDDVVAELAALRQAIEMDERAGERCIHRYQLTCRRGRETMNSAYRDASRTRSKHPVNWAYMNPDDMVAEGLSEGDAVAISSAHGVIVGRVRAEERLRRGVVSMTHLVGELLPANDPDGVRGAFTGRLTSLREDLQPINFMPRFSGVPISVVRHAPGADVEGDDVESGDVEGDDVESGDVEVTVELASLDR